MTIQKDNFENCSVPLLEYVDINDPRQAKCYVYLDKTFLFIRYISESTRFLGELLKKDLLEIDPLKEPEKHKVLTLIAEDVSKLHSSSSASGWEYFFENLFNHLEKKA
jgi:hypothetical protein